jgi:hypothetical protein
MTLFIIYSYDIGERYDGAVKSVTACRGKNIMKKELGNGG